MDSSSETNHPAKIDVPLTEEVSASVSGLEALHEVNAQASAAGYHHHGTQRELLEGADGLLRSDSIRDRGPNSQTNLRMAPHLTFLPSVWLPGAAQALPTSSFPQAYAPLGWHFAPPNQHGFTNQYMYLPPNPPPLLNSVKSTRSADETPLLQWIEDRYLSENEKLDAIRALLRKDFDRMTPTGFLLRLIDEKKGSKDVKKGFYASGAIPDLLDAISKDPRGRKKLDEWYSERALDMVLDRVDREMSALSLRNVVTLKNIEPEQLMNFDAHEELTKTAEEESPTLRRILIRAAQSDRAEEENKCKNVLPPCTIIHFQLCNLRSQRSIFFQAALSYNLYGLGVPKHVMDFLSKCGLTVCYSTIHKGHKALSAKMLELAKPVARGVHVLSFDNIELSTSIHVEQREFAPPKVSSGTTIYIYPAPYASPDACLLKPILERRDKCEMITYANDIRPKRKELGQQRAHLVLHLIHILLDECVDFKNWKWKDDKQLQHTVHRAHKNGMKTEQNVLRTIRTSEGSIDGCIEVIRNAYVDQLGLEANELDDRANPSIHDQLTNSNIRGGQLLRKKDVSGIHTMASQQLGPGLFHVELNMLWAILVTHRGCSEDPGSLQFYITLLRLTRLNSDRPDFYTLRTFLRKILVAHILECWEIKCGKNSLKEFAESEPNPDVLLEMAEGILIEFASSPDFESEIKSDTCDFTLRNFKLLNRDLLYFFELSAAISSGDFGRVELFLGAYLEMFTGAGCKNYSTELLHFIQNLKKVWGPFGDVMRDSMIVNMSGRDGHSIGRDMNIEHGNNYQKSHFFAKGMHGSLDTLADLSPCMPVYQQLKLSFSNFVEASWQGSKHQRPSIAAHVRMIRSKIQEIALIHLDRHDRDVSTDNKTIDIQSRGQDILMDRGIKRFTEQYIAFVKRNEEFEEEEDEIPQNEIVLIEEDELDEVDD